MNYKPSVKPLETRIYHYRSPTTRFYCPLCRTQRAFTSTPRLSKKNYLQITLVSLILGAILFPLMQMKSFFLFFVVWALFEMVVRIYFRREIPCPHCGFDASWYKRDVTVARKLVQEFWQEKNKIPNQPDNESDNQAALN